MKVIIWDLPEKEIEYLKRNCKAQFDAGEICLAGTPAEKMSAENMMAEKMSTKKLPTEKEVQENETPESFQIEQFDVDELLLISQNPEILAQAVCAGVATLAYQAPVWQAIDVPLNYQAPAWQAIDVPLNYQAPTSVTAFQDIPDVFNISSTGTGISFPAVDMVAEGFEEIDYAFLARVYKRHHNIPWTIFETERLVVRELSLADMDELFELYSYAGMTDYMEGLYPYEEEYAYQKAYIENMYRFFGYGMWLVFEKKTGKLVGRAGVEHREALEGELELGYAIGAPWQGQGYATEVCKGILAYVNEELGFDRICSLVQPANEASIKLLKKLGFHEVKELTLDEICYKKFEKTL